MQELRARDGYLPGLRLHPSGVSFAMPPGEMGEQMKQGVARTGQRVRHPSRGKGGRGTIARVYRDWQDIETAIIDYDTGEREATRTVWLIDLSESREEHAS